MKHKGILAGLMGSGLVVAAVLIYEKQCDPGELILGAIVMSVASGLAAAIVVENISSLYVFVDVVVVGIYIYHVIKSFHVVERGPILSPAVGIVVGLIYGVSLYVGWLRKSLNEGLAEP